VRARTLPSTHYPLGGRVGTRELFTARPRILISIQNLGLNGSTLFRRAAGMSFSHAPICADQNGLPRRRLVRLLEIPLGQVFCGYFIIHLLQLFSLVNISWVCRCGVCTWIAYRYFRIFDHTFFLWIGNIAIFISFTIFLMG
jgi:hypothetical protein